MYQQQQVQYPQGTVVQQPYGQQYGQATYAPGYQTQSGCCTQKVVPDNANELKPITDVSIADQMAFVRKVYMLLTVMLLFTGAFMTPFVIFPEVRLYVQQNTYVYYAGLAMALVGLIAISCFESVSRTFPANYFFCALTTLGYSILLGVNAAFFDLDEILIAVGITFAIVFFCTLFACQTSYDFTTKLPYLLAGFFALIIAGIFAIFIFPSRASFMMLSGLGAFLFACFLIYDTQIILGGSHKFQLDEREHVFAALNIYVDIVIIFQCILGLAGSE